MESLKNNLIQACDGERVSLHCPRNTHIYLVNTFYGRLVPSFELCPAPTSTTPQQNSSSPSSSSSAFTTNGVDIFDEDTSCHIASAHSVVFFDCD
ncbi:unnamed protein product [Enterobius vermicularis]|uniref:Glycoprotein X n=1 Tax=Enterobius vermicularis TaxID=51028 RepID=A0A0N4UT96_ENTVE|nr:unnamed protein product [Enterobius vermicularis]